MMMSLFISFDPMITTFTPMILVLLPVILLLTSNKSVATEKLMNNMKHSLSNELKIATKINSNLLGLVLFSLFMFIMLNNVIGLLPFIFTTTAHLATTLTFGISFWLTTVLVGAIFKFQEFVAHLVPSGCPLALAQFMVLIESISLLIRPITLSVRLAANMTAGHLLLILCSSPIVVINFMSLSLIILIILESAVALIQAYVFTVLVAMYIGENN